MVFFFSCLYVSGRSSYLSESLPLLSLSLSRKWLSDRNMQSILQCVLRFYNGLRQALYGLCLRSRSTRAIRSFSRKKCNRKPFCTNAKVKSKKKKKWKKIEIKRRKTKAEKCYNCIAQYRFSFFFCLQAEPASHKWKTQLKPERQFLVMSELEGA